MSIQDVSIQVEGSNNRVAGRDYIEIKSPKLCTCCAMRFVEGREVICVVCKREQARLREERLRAQALENFKDKISFFACVTILIWACLVVLGSEPGDPVDGRRIFLLFVGSVGVVLLAAAFFTWFRHWWLWHGDALKSALSRRLIAGLKRLFT
ncbi:hypothetical protein [Zestomonas carbonaria]|uniref:hypothetical protein n=1 Tax=Zestomonas carbonaria TaxID=2762745 RepID=UPI0016573AA8|nr:hypothetical protein [Pseudomonas carbonaria]